MLCIRRRKVSFPSPGKVLNPILRAAEEVHAALGPGLAPKAYADALEEKFPRGKHGMERDVFLPMVRDKGSFVPADFTFVHRNILVRVTSYPEPLHGDTWTGMRSRLEAAGLSLALVLNFGVEEPDFLRVIHQENLIKWKRACRKRRALREAGLEATDALGWEQDMEDENRSA
jgi:GxxExxY protein